MKTPVQQDITQMLQAWSAGDTAVLDQLAPLLQPELRRIAKQQLARVQPDHLLQTTALVNEAYVRLLDGQSTDWQNRAHFFGVAAHLMRRVLVDEYRARQSRKRGGAALRVSLNEAEAQAQVRSADLLALDEALQTLAKLDARKCRIVELRYFGGLSVEETATVLQLSARTINREWSLAQAWLFRELRRNTNER